MSPLPSVPVTWCHWPSLSALSDVTATWFTLVQVGLQSCEVRRTAKATLPSLRMKSRRSAMVDRAVPESPKPMMWPPPVVVVLTHAVTENESIESRRVLAMARTVVAPLNTVALSESPTTAPAAAVVPVTVRSSYPARSVPGVAPRRQYASGFASSTASG